MSNTFSVLIVEDDEDEMRNMEDILSLDGYRLRTESSCLQAINAVENERFDAVIVDWRLPDENADQLIPIITRTQANAPVIVVTGMRDFDTSVSALRSGVYDFLLKPINADLLRAVLRRLVERKKHLAEIESGREKLLVNERLAAIGQMVTGLAHESRNAFQRSHACLAELALDLEAMPDSLELVHKVQKALDDLNFLLEQVRDYSAPINLERRMTSLASLTEEVWQEILEAKASQAAPRFSLQTTLEFPNELSIDPERFRQVIRNLLENASFASGVAGTVGVQLEIERADQPFVRLAVEDSGDGVTAEDIEKVFRPFFTTKTKGTGLGLALSQRIVEAHHGRIYIERADSGGARFVVEIPQRTK